MKKALLKIEYDGTLYHGWQTQPNGITIQEKIETALEKILQVPTRVRAVSRTDSGVHALGQVGSIFIPSSFPLRKLLFGLNALLPRDIAIVDMVEISENYDVRKENRGKCYQYRIYQGSVKKAVGRELYWWVRSKLDREKMIRAAQSFIGTHDFAAFQGKGGQELGSVKRLTKVELNWNQEKIHPELMISIEGNGFLRNMVRIMVGTLVDIGQDKLSEGVIATALSTKDRKILGVTAPPAGLVLKEIFFDPDPFVLRRGEAWEK